MSESKYNADSIDMQIINAGHASLVGDGVVVYKYHYLENGVAKIGFKEITGSIEGAIAEHYTVLGHVPDVWLDVRGTLVISYSEVECRFHGIVACLDLALEFMTNGLCNFHRSTVVVTNQTRLSIMQDFSQFCINHVLEKDSHD